MHMSTLSIIFSVGCSVGCLAVTMETGGMFGGWCCLILLFITRLNHCDQNGASMSAVCVSVFIYIYSKCVWVQHVFMCEYLFMWVGGGKTVYVCDCVHGWISVAPGCLCLSVGFCVCEPLKVFTCPPLLEVVWPGLQAFCCLLICKYTYLCRLDDDVIV